MLWYDFLHLHHSWRKFQELIFSDALEWLFYLPFYFSQWFKKMFKIHLLRYSRMTFSLPLYLHHGWRKFSKFTFSDALEWLFYLPFHLHNGWRKFSKFAFSGALQWLFPFPFTYTMAEENFQKSLSFRCTRMPLSPPLYLYPGWRKLSKITIF